MKKRCIKALSVFFFAVFLLYGMEAKAVTTTCTTYKGSNVEGQTYSRWSNPINSYLVSGNDGTLMRVQYGSGIGGVLVEYYDSAYNIDEERSRILDQELPLFGGFYETDRYYFLLTGQNNSGESADVEVYRITKYDKDWNRLGAAGLYDCNTTVPFSSGSARMDASGNYLLIRTSHKMYKSDTDGLNHQANVTIQLDMETMAITDSYTKIMNLNYGYVSHSFNQFIKVENNRIVSVDHGDAYPRSIVLLKYQTDISNGKFVPTNNPCQAVDVLEFPGKSGQNSTGAAVGGFEISDTSYLVAGHSVVQDEDNLTRKTRNIFVAAVDKTTSEVTMNWLTSYDEGDGTTSTPQMVRISDSRYLILWSRNNTVYYTEVDGNGQQAGAVYQCPGSLSDCVPVISDGKVIWYTWNGGTITFYDIRLDNPEQANVTEIVNGHDFENTGVSGGNAILICKKCQEEQKVAVAASVTCWWNEDGQSSYFSYFPSEKEIGEQIYYWIQYTPSGADGEMEVISSDESVASVTRQSSGRGYLTMKRAGTAVITVRPKLNPEVYRNFTLTVQDTLNVDSFTADPSSAQYVGTEIILRAQASGGRERYQYQFYVEEENGANSIIQEYASSNTCIWIPQTTGKKTLHVQVKDAKGNVKEKAISDYEVKKWPSPVLEKLVKSYRYTTGAAHEKIAVSEYLPKAMRDAEYSAAIVDSNGILDQVSVDTDGLLTYQVKNTGAIGDAAEIRIAISSANYEDTVLKILIQLTDKEVIAEKEGRLVAIAGSNQLTYGQRLAVLQLGKDAVFVANDGTEVEGNLSWKEPESIPTVGTVQAEWIFTPNDEDSYTECQGSLAIEVIKATPEVTVPSVAGFVYEPSRKLADVALNGENGTAVVGGSRAEVVGSWSFLIPDTVPTVDRRSYVAVFTPEDAWNYNAVEVEVSIEVEKASPTITVQPAAAGITYGTALADVVISGGRVMLGNTEIPGTWSFRDGALVPSAGSRAYAAVFMPEDTVNYHFKETEVMLSVAKVTPEVVILPEAGELTYGAALEDAGLHGGSVMAGTTEVEGVWRFQTPGVVPTAGSHEYIAVFTPENASNCNSVEARITVVVSKAAPEIQELPQAGKLTYGESLEEAGLVGGVAAVGDTEISGTWSFQNPDERPLAGRSSYQAVFTPDDLQNYSLAEVTVMVEVEKAVPEIIEMPQIGQLVYGASLQDAVIRGGRAISKNVAVAGRFAFRNAQMKPEVKDSGITQYELVFLPGDAENYQSVSCGTVSVTVHPAELKTERPDSSMIVEYEVDTVGRIPLPEGWSWKAEDAAKRLPAGGFIQATAVYRDTKNYKNAFVEIMVNRKACVNHQYTSVITKAPTVSSEGVRTYTCKICGAVRTESIPKFIAAVKKNLTRIVGSLKYKVTKAGTSGVAEVTVVGVDKKNRKSVTIPQTVQIDGVTCKVTGIGAKAFYNCKSLRRITVKTTALKKVGKNTIKGIHKKAVIKVPKSKLKAYKKKFNKKSGFQKTMKIKK